MKYFNNYLHKPSGIISKRLLDAENVSRLHNLPIPDGIPSKSSSLSFKYNLLKVVILQRVAGKAFNLLCDKFNVSSFCHNSIAETNLFQLEKMYTLSFKLG